MDVRMPQEQLVRLVQELGRELAETRQVARRLRELFPGRYRDLLAEFRELTGAHRERVCLQDPRYLSSIEELVEIRMRAMRLKVMYDSHVMLYQARQSLRGMPTRSQSGHLRPKDQ